MKKKDIKKISGVTTTHVLYEGPDGEVVTSTEIAKGNVKSRPSSWKPKSLSDLVQSPSFGSKVRGVSKKNSKRAKRVERINKISYESGSGKVPTRGPSALSSGRDSHTETGGFGYILNDIRYGDFDLENYSKDGDVSMDNINLSDLLNLIDCLVDIANTMDDSNHHKNADFIDSMIKLAKDASNIDYSKRFNELLKVVNKSEAGNINKLLINISKKFSEDINKYMLNNKNSNINDAKKNAYEKSLKNFKEDVFWPQ